MSYIGDIPVRVQVHRIIFFLLDLTTVFPLLQLINNIADVRSLSVRR